MKILNEKIVELKNGMRVVNTTPHPFKFDDGTVVEDCGMRLDAAIKEEIVEEKDGIKFVRTIFEPNETGNEMVMEAERLDIFLLASSIAVNAYKNSRVVLPVGVNPRARPEERVVFSNKFMVG